MPTLEIDPAAIFCDFDGTIILVDGTDAVLEKFAAPKWRDWEAGWVAGEVSTQECLARQVELLRVDKTTLTEFAASLPFDEGFFQIVRECQKRGIPLTIVSDGLDVVAKTVLIRHGLGHLPLYASRLEWVNADRSILKFPYETTSCTSRAGTCKCALAGASQAPADRVVYIGDGRSDFCVADKGHQVFAKGPLKSWCAAREISFEPFDTLDHVARRLFSEKVLAP